MSKFTTALCIGTALLLLTACGGSGGSVVSSSAPELTSINSQNEKSVVASAAQLISGDTTGLTKKVI